MFEKWTERFFMAFWLCAMMIILVLLFGCELPRASQNYNPSSAYQWVP